MDLFSRLAETTRRQNSEGELPDFIVPLLLEVANNPDRYEEQTDLVTSLLEAVDEYETYSNVCCEKIGFSLEDINTRLDRLGVSY